jgi:integration host factor subunit alpha
VKAFGKRLEQTAEGNLDHDTGDHDTGGRGSRMALTKAWIAVRLHEELGLNKREAKDLVEGFFEEMRRALEMGEQVKLSGFGNFDLRSKSRRPGRNPKTGEPIPITARRVVTFRPGQKLKARVEAYAGSIEH